MTLRKRVTFKKILARTRRHAEDLALDLFEITHKTREGAEYGAEAVLIAESPVREAPVPVSGAEIQRKEGTSCERAKHRADPVPDAEAGA